MSQYLLHNPLPDRTTQPYQMLDSEDRGKVYADVPLNFFANIDSLKKYVLNLKEMGVNVLLILPHFEPSFSAYVVKNYEKPCALFGDWQQFTDFMIFVEKLGMDRMIDIPFNHADWQADNLKREWYKNHDDNGVEAGADDVDADGNRVRINWGAFILDNSLKELQDYWLEKVIFPHIEKMHINAIRIDAAWGLDAAGLKRMVQETRKRFPHVWFLAENLGMARLIKLAESGIAAGADRYFNNMYWYSGGHYIPGDIYTFYKRSGGVPACTIYSSHDTLLPAMKSYARLRSNDVKGMNDKAIVRQFVEREQIRSLSQIDKATAEKTIASMKLDFALAALMSSDVMFAAGSELGLFERIDVCRSGPQEFARGIDSDLPEFMRELLKIKFSHPSLNNEGVVIPFGVWQPDKSGLRGYVKTDKAGNKVMVAVNSDNKACEVVLPRRMKTVDDYKIMLPQGYMSVKADEMPSSFTLPAGQIVVIISKG